MELRHLKALEAVLATGSFTAAAAARHVSQPALWAQVKELEAELGLTLFTRAGRGVVPTAACDALRPALAHALSEVQAFRDAALRIRDGHAAPARVGCAPSHVSRFLAGCLGDLAADAPFPVIVPLTTGTAIEALATGRVDLLAEPRAEPLNEHAVKLYPMRVVALGPAAEGAGDLEVRALDGATLATLPEDSLTRRMLEQAATRARITTRVVHESRDANALLALARHGLCTVVVHDEMLPEADARAARRLVDGGRPLEVPIWLAWHREQALSPAARALRDVMIRRATERAPLLG